MSSLAVNAITDASGGTTASINGYTPTASNMAGKNRIINGAMVIDQRNAGASVTPTEGQYSLDRWQARLNQSSKFSIQQNAGSVTPPAGFKNYLGVTSLSSYSPAASDYFGVQQNIEGFNTADLDWGTANAKAITVSFWVRSSLTGTFPLTFINDGFARGYVTTYTISAANTWEYKTITLAGDTTGTWTTNNSAGLRLWFTLGAGSSQVATPNVWGSFVGMGAAGAVNVVGTSGATFYITGVQLEVGSAATEFEHRLYGQELALCQRYYEKSGTEALFSGNVTSGGEYYNFVYYKVTKRASATVTPTNWVALSFPSTASLVNNNGVEGFQLYRTANASARGYFFDSWTASSEL